ncbi:hypothetical protein [Aporhodopirellula aestuarii]|uniref:Uncharacterized protein n=1 Tax=Aporhodopirellula aestuarii TaxID=2950107 RepID=A0ABT0UBI0_9BACT|nr:hypothetical protein [Aporhodopirellula aestuarii]MCM2374347.1 hypothetical protein [Aporhodopirellula aestuarii]
MNEDNLAPSSDLPLIIAFVLVATLAIVAVALSAPLGHPSKAQVSQTVSGSV